MTQSNAARMSLHIAKSLAAQAAMDKIRDLALDAQASRDEAQIRFNLDIQNANGVFALGVAEVTDEYNRQLRSLAVDEDDYGDELDR